MLRACNNIFIEWYKVKQQKTKQKKTLASVKKKQWNQGYYE